MRLRSLALLALAMALIASVAIAQTAKPMLLQPLADKPGPAPAGLNTGAKFYVPATVNTVNWGVLPDANTKPILTVPSGSVVTFDTVSHEGILEDQGRDPVKFFAKYGVPANQVLKDAQALAADSNLKHDFAGDGPHIVIGPVQIDDAKPGDILRIDMVSLTPRVPYGVVSNRHGKGALPGEFPEGEKPAQGASATQPDLYHNVFRFVSVSMAGGQMTCTMKDPTNGKTVSFPGGPFQGIMGVTPNEQKKTNSVPPGDFGGNLDLKYLTKGATLYLPVQVPGAMFFIADPHFAQGDGEVALTAVEGSLRTTLKLTVIKAGQAGVPGVPFKEALKSPFAETAQYWIPMGLDPDLNEAMKKATRNAVSFLATTQGVDRATALAYLSAATNFEVTEVVDKTKGVHGLIRKADWQKGGGAKRAVSTRAEADAH